MTASDLKILKAAHEQISELKQIIAKQQKQIDRLTELLALSVHKKYGRSRERYTGPDQLMLFEDAEVSVSSAPEIQETAVKAHTRKRKRSSEESYSHLPIAEVCEHKLDEDERICPKCRKVMTASSKITKDLLRLKPELAELVRHIFVVYSCAGTHREPHDKVTVQSDDKVRLYPKCIATSETVAQIITQKTVMGVPLYRQEQQWNRQNVPLSRQSMSNWIINCSERYFQPIYDVLHDLLCQRSVLHADETHLNVLDEKKRNGSNTGQIWLFRTSGDTDKPIVLYEYNKSHSGDVAKKFLTGFTGYLHVDGRQGYHKLEDKVTLITCLTHVRRKFFDIISGLPPEGLKGSSAALAVQYCDKIFKIDHQFDDLPPDERQKEREKILRPVVNKFFQWAESMSSTTSDSSKFGKAIKYALNQRKRFEHVFLDGRLELSNNRAERSIKPFVVGRKNFLFANTARGAKASAVMYSITETAIENGLLPFAYIKWVLDNAPALSQTNPLDWAVMLAPHNAPGECRANRQ